MKRTILGTGLLTFAMLIAQPASAAPIKLEVGSGSSGGFGWSYLHTATSSHSSGFWMSGAKQKITVGDDLFGSWDGTTLSGIFGNLGLDEADLDIGGGTLVDGIVITGGMLRGDFDGTGTAGAGNLGGGFLDYSLRDDANAEVDSGTFFFMSKSFSNASAPKPNAFEDPSSDDDDYALWGNNWLNETGSFGAIWQEMFVDSTGWMTQADLDGLADAKTDVAYALGMDLRGPGTPPELCTDCNTTVPEPTTLLLAGLGLIGAGLRRRAN